MPRVNLFTPSLLPSIRSLPFFRHHSVHLLVSLSPYRSFVHLRVYMQRRKEGRKDHVIKCNNWPKNTAVLCTLSLKRLWIWRLLLSSFPFPSLALRCFAFTLLYLQREREYTVEFSSVQCTVYSVLVRVAVAESWTRKRSECKRKRRKYCSAFHTLIQQRPIGVSLCKNLSCALPPSADSCATKFRWTSNWRARHKMRRDEKMFEVIGKGSTVRSIVKPLIVL